jgi:hypothetical protein
MRSLALLLASSAALATVPACSINLGDAVGFDIPYDIPEQTVPGDPTANASGVVVDAPFASFPVNIDVAQQAQANGVSGVVSTVTLTSLSLSITQGSGCFDFVQSISITLASTKPGSTLQPVVIATGSNPGCVQTWDLQTSPVNIKPYLDEGAEATPSGQGIPPAADVSFDGHLVAHASL